MNAIFAYFKQMLTDEDIQTIAERIESDDFRSVWLTASVAQNPNIELHRPGLR
jgi:hypothetical protein